MSGADLGIAAIVVAWNSDADLAVCLTSLDGQEHRLLEVVVVDNASSDGTARIIDQHLAAGTRYPTRVVRNVTNRGFSGGVNDGLAALGPDVDAILLVNPDVQLAPDVVGHLAAALHADPRRGSIQPKLVRRVPDASGDRILDTTGHVLTTARLLRNRGEGEVDRGQYDEPGEVFGASGALVLHRRSMLDDVAWRLPTGELEVLNEDLFAFFDDVELDWRARLRGWTAWYEPRAVAIHQRGGAGPRRDDRVEALNWSNQLLVIATSEGWRALGRALPLVALTTTLKTGEFVLTHPRAVPMAVRRLRLFRRARWRRRQLVARAVVTHAEVVGRHLEAFSWRIWVGTWWRRVTGRAPGVG